MNSPVAETKAPEPSKRSRVDPAGVCQPTRSTRLRVVSGGITSENAEGLGSTQCWFSKTTRSTRLLVADGPRQGTRPLSHHRDVARTGRRKKVPPSPALPAGAVRHVADLLVPFLPPRLKFRQPSFQLRNLLVPALRLRVRRHRQSRAMPPPPLHHNHRTLAHRTPPHVHPQFVS
jgi:hypothetical protein